MPILSVRVSWKTDRGNRKKPFLASKCAFQDVKQIRNENECEFSFFSQLFGEEIYSYGRRASREDILARPICVHRNTEERFKDWGEVLFTFYLFLEVMVCDVELALLWYKNVLFFGNPRFLNYFCLKFLLKSLHE